MHNQYSFNYFLINDVKLRLRYKGVDKVTDTRQDKKSITDFSNKNGVYQLVMNKIE